MEWAWATAFLVVFVAEFADKTQLVLLGLASRGRPGRVWAGAAAAFLVLTVLAALAGDLVARWVPAWTVTLAAGLLFLLFGLLGLRPEDEEDTAAPRTSGLRAAFGLILVAEMGDKTQISVAALAAKSGALVATVVGATLALWASAALAVLAGGWLARHVDPHRVRRIAAILFLVLGALLLLSLAAPITII